MTETLGTLLPKEMARVRDKLFPTYDAIPSGKFATTLMRHDLDLAAKATAEGDVVEMIRACKKLQDYKA